MNLTPDPKLAFYSLLTGIVLGVVFTFLKLPVPAPAVFEGAIGVLGTCVGGIIGPTIRTLITRLFQ